MLSLLVFWSKDIEGMSIKKKEKISFTKMKYRIVFMLFQKLFQNLVAEIFKIPKCFR